MNRRHFLTFAGSCCAHMMTLANSSPVHARKVFAPQDTEKIVAQEKFGRVEKVSDGIWSVISTPFESKDFTTVSNGGIIAGTERTIVVEAFMKDEGAKWISGLAKKLTGRAPTDVVCTHYHADHTGGHGGFVSDKAGERIEDSSPAIWLTKSTHEAAVESLEKRNGNAKFTNFKELSAEQPTEIDLGGRVVKIVPRIGHTASDVTIEVVDPKIVFTGDLFFNRMFPNYSDAVPSRLNKYVAEMIATKDTIFVPGHGPVADMAALESYQEFLSFVKDRATAAFKKGDPAEEAGKSFKLPDSLSEWLVWNDQVAINGYKAWYRELKSSK